MSASLIGRSGSSAFKLSMSLAGSCFSPESAPRPLYWVRGDFDTEDGPLSSADATIIILLPIVAAAIGMMTFGIEFQIVEHSV